MTSERQPLLSSEASSSRSSVSSIAFNVTSEFDYTGSGFAPPITPATSYSPNDAEDMQSSKSPCKSCPAGVDPSKQQACKLVQNGEDERAWITAHNPEKCCGHEHRTLVLCFDGTGDQFDESNSSIVNFVSMLRKDKNPRQLVYYQAGLGTYTDPMFKGTVSSTLSMTLDQMVAWNLESHVTDGYRFLMEHYTHGDKICIFGFSRGAYTARAVAGMLQKVGLLPTCNHQQVPFAYKMYARDDKEGYEMSRHFKLTFSRAVSVHFLGVWDTVASVGLIPKYLPFTSENTGIRYLRHAIALDEHRVKFLPSFCVDGTKKDKKVDGAAERETDGSGATGHSESVQTNASANGTTKSRKKPERQASAAHHYESLVNSKDTTDVQEVWFAGVHCDIGGGAVTNKEPTYLARIPLRWMIRECFNCNSGIVFDARMLQTVGLPVYRDARTRLPTLAPLYVWNADEKKKRAFPPDHKPIPPKSTTLLGLIWEKIKLPFRVIGKWFESTPGNTFETWKDLGDDELMDRVPDEYAADLADITTEEHDQMQARPLWLFMESLPMYMKSNKAIKAGEKAGYNWVWNRGKGRKIPKSELEEGWKVHRTVKMRLEWDPLYIPRVRPNVETGRTITTWKGKTKVERVARQLTRDEWNTASPQHFEWVPANPPKPALTPSAPAPSTSVQPAAVDRSGIYHYR